MAIANINKKLSALLLALVLLFSSLTSVAAVNTRSNLFLEMMLTMMEVMGFIDRDRNVYNQTYPSLNSLPYGSSMMGNPMQNWLQTMALQQMLSGAANPALYGGMLTPGLAGLPGNQATIPFLPEYLNQQAKTHWIEGKWRSRDGMIMEVHHGYFKMYYPNRPREVRGGLIRIKDRWLAIHEKSRNFTRQFEFGYKDDRLVLKDTNGNLMLFKRMTDWLNPLQ